MQLVNWDGKQFRYGAGIYPTKTALLDAIDKAKRPKELTDLIDALDALWKRIGAAGNCQKCFEGTLSRPKEAHGCCGACPHLGETRCIAKPLGCALYSCGTDHLGKRDTFNDGRRAGQLDQLRFILSRAEIPIVYFSHGFFVEASRIYTAEQRAVMTAAKNSLSAIY